MKVIIAAQSKDGFIGFEGSLPWHHPEELKHFRKTTSGYPMVMGRKTFESMPKLKDRPTFVVSRAMEPTDGITICPNVEAALSEASKISDVVFIVGGGDIYKQTIGYVDKIILTTLNEEYMGDVKFPPIPECFEHVSTETLGCGTIQTYINKQYVNGKGEI
jgi:dihydrofolate reductase